MLRYFIKQKYPFKPRTDEELKNQREGAELLSSAVGDIDMITDWIYYMEISSKLGDEFVGGVSETLINIQLISCICGSISWLCIISDGRLLDISRKLIRRIFNISGVCLIYIVFVFPLLFLSLVSRCGSCNKFEQIIDTIDRHGCICFDKLKSISHRLKLGFEFTGGTVAFLGIIFEDIPQLIVTFLIENTGDGEFDFSSTAQLNLLTSSFDILHKFADAYDARNERYRSGRKGLVRIFRGHKNGLTSVAMLDNNRFITGSWDHSIKLWDIEKNDCIRTFLGHSDLVFDVKKVGDKLLASASKDQYVKVFHTETGDCLHDYFHPTSVYCIAVSPDGCNILSGGEDGHIRWYNLSSITPLQTYCAHTERVIQIEFLDEEHFVSVGSDTTAILWQMKNHEPIRVFSGHRGGIFGLAKLDSQSFLTGSEDTTILRWDTQSTSPIMSYVGHRNTILSIKSSVDYDRFISTCATKTVRLWATHSGSCIWKFVGHEKWVYGCELLPQGNKFLTVSADTTCILWDLDQVAAEISQVEEQEKKERNSNNKLEKKRKGYPKTETINPYPLNNRSKKNDKTHQLLHLDSVIIT